MKKIFLAVLFLTFNFEAFARSFEAVVRTQRNRAVMRSIELEDLISDHSFDGKYFKIVKGKSDEAISFEEERGLLIKAATTYYHLTKARSYFVDKIKSTYVQGLPKTIIRLDLINQFSELGHFANDNYEPQFNNALTVPAGTGLSSKGVKPWGMEIWFRPRKEVHLNDLAVNGLGGQEVKSLMKSYRDQLHMQTLQRFLATSITAMMNNISQSTLFTTDNLFRTAGSSLIIEFGYQFTDPISQAVARKWYWLDTALVPEIIYHEYSHAALSDALVLSHSTAVIEGMADFFAGQIANSPKLAKKIKKYNTYNGKNAKRKQEYMIQFELGQYANTDFVFGLLWQLKKVVGDETGEAFMYELRKSIKTNSSIRVELVEGILKTCDNICHQPFVDKIRLLKALNIKGL